MREKDLYRAIDKLLPKTIHRQSMTGAAMTGNGVPDRYYDGPRGDLWVEYKMLTAMPRSGLAVGAYTPLQLAWMERRFDKPKNPVHAPNIVGVVGLPNRTAVIQQTPTEWRTGSTINTAKSLKEVAEWIHAMCGG